MAQEKTTMPSHQDPAVGLSSSGIPQSQIFITPRTNILLFMIVFYTILLVYILLALFSPESVVFQYPLHSDHILLNFLFLAFCFVFIALGIHTAVRFCCRKVLVTKWFRPKLGEICIREGSMSDEQLRQALAEQKQRVGEVLVQGGRLTAGQLEEALARQKGVSAPLGRILQELGYVSEEDIDWALSQMGRKLGEILIAKGIITKDDLPWLLGQQAGPRRI
jgi:hypothetical protein